MLINKTKHGDKLRFAIIGGLNTAIDFGILFGLAALGMDKLVANFFSTSIAFTFSFFANKSYTFKDKDKANKRQFLSFLVVTLSGLWIIQPAVIYPVFLLLDSHLDEATALLLAKLFATVASMIWNYKLYSKVVFNQN